MYRAHGLIEYHCRGCGSAWFAKKLQECMLCYSTAGVHVLARGKTEPVAPMNAAINMPAWCADAWLMHQIFRKLGFAPDDIYFDCHDTLDGGPNCILVSVKEGEREFIMNLGRTRTSREESYRLWAAFAADMNAASAAEHQALWDSSVIQQKLPRVELILRLIDKGFSLDKVFDPGHVELLRSARADFARKGTS